MKIKQIKNFFDVEDLNLICSLKLNKKISNNESAVYHNKISKDGHVSSDLIDDVTLQSFQKMFPALTPLSHLNPGNIF